MCVEGRARSRESEKERRETWQTSWTCMPVNESVSMSMCVEGNSGNKAFLEMPR